MYPSVLWHYTDAAGLAGILRSASLWLSDIRYLNDRSERRYGRDVLVNTIDQELEFHDQFDLLKATQLCLDTSKEHPIHACSLSERKDSISQWQRYGANGTGYCIGFKIGEECRAVLQQHDVVLIKMVYQRDSQEMLVRKQIRDLLRTYAPELARREEGDLRNGYLNLVAVASSIGLERFMLRFKDSRFEDEQEWRLIHELNSSRTDRAQQVNFAQRGEYLKPYVSLPLQSPDASILPVVSIVCGPKLDPELAEPSVADFANSLGYRDVVVVTSGLRTLWR